MAASSLSAASVCARRWIRGPQWQPRSFIRNVSRTSAINRGIRASQNSPSDRERPSFAGRKNDTYAAGSPLGRRAGGFSDDAQDVGRNDRRGGRSSDKRETRRDQRRSDRKDGPDERKSNGNGDDVWKGMVDLKSTVPARGGRDRTRASDRSARPTRDGARDAFGSFDRSTRPARNGDKSSAAFSDRSSRPSAGGSRDAEKKSRFDNEGVRAYGDKTGFFSTGSRSRRAGDRPALDRSARPTRDGERPAFDRGARPARDGDRPSFDKSAQPTRDGERFSLERRARPARDGERSSSGSFDRSARPTRDGERSSSGSFDRTSRPTRDGDRGFSDRSSRPVKSDRIQHDDVPVAIPYSSAASQWLYGVNTVVAALRGNQRKFYQLIIKKGERTAETDQILQLAQKARITIQTHDDTRLLDKLSEGRPHNGAVLEVSALPARPTVHLGKPDPQTNNIPLELHKQTAEDMAVNGDSTILKFDGRSWRQPFVLFLDGITDPGNLGGILRTAHFYGVDAVAVATNTCASLNSPVLAKASAGACEAIPIFAVSKPADFISKSAHAGWRICAAVAPDVRTHKIHKILTSASLSVRSPLAAKPCILMMGSEGEGLRENLRSKADLEVTISRGPAAKNTADVGVDSMNASVATGVLVDAFTREPLASPFSAGSDRSNRVF